MEGWLAPVLMFIIGIGVVMGGYAAVTWLPGELTRRRIDQRISEVATPYEPEDRGSAHIVKRGAQGVMPALDRYADTTPWGSASAKLIEQAGSKIGVSTLMLSCVLGALVCSIGATAVFRLSAAGIPGALVGGALPYLVLLRKRTMRMRKFEEQFPEALDLLSRAIRAGHAFTTAVGMVADEAPDPIGPEFKKTFDEQNFGMPLKDALGNLGQRVPLIDVHFFVTAVLIQRETGGNLSEILDNLSHVVRERFKILRQVRVYTAHGRLTGYVLMALPAALAVALSFINPALIDLLLKERMGQLMLMGAVVMQAIGYFWIRQVVKIEV
jgi:tight adherence protein B